MYKVSVSKHQKFEKAQINFREATCSLEQLAKTVTLSAWSPILFTGGERKVANFVSAQVIALDIDDGLTISEAKNKLEKSGYNYILATSKSHQIDKNGVTCDRYRIIIPLSEPCLNPSRYKQTIKSIISELNIPADPAAVDAARFFFPCKQLISINTLGRPASLAEPKPEPQPAKPASKPLGVKAGERGGLSYETLAFLVFGAPKGEWHGAFIRAVIDVKSQSYTQEEAGELLAKASPAGRLDKTDLKQIKDVYSRKNYQWEFREKNRAGKKNDYLKKMEAAMRSAPKITNEKN